METWKFRKNSRHWYLIPSSKNTLFNVLLTEDDVLFADEFDGYVITNIESYEFELPIVIEEEDGE